MRYLELLKELREMYTGVDYEVFELHLNQYMMRNTYMPSPQELAGLSYADDETDTSDQEEQETTGPAFTIEEVEGLKSGTAIKFEMDPELILNAYRYASYVGNRTFVLPDGKETWNLAPGIERIHVESPHKASKCECGALKAGTAGHSTWCPMRRED